jgi:hypothetical protein
LLWRSCSNMNLTTTFLENFAEEAGALSWWCLSPLRSTCVLPRSPGHWSPLASAGP